MKKFLFLLGLTLFTSCAPAFAVDSYTWYGAHSSRLPSGVSSLISTIEIRPTEKKGAIAEIYFYNEDVHEFKKDTVVLEYAGNSYTIILTINTLDKDDTLEIIVPAGYVAVPNPVDSAEQTATIVYIYPLEGVGM